MIAAANNLVELHCGGNQRFDPAHICELRAAHNSHYEHNLYGAKAHWLSPQDTLDSPHIAQTLDAVRCFLRRWRTHR